MLLAGAPNRYSIFKDVPTIKEAGLGNPIVTNRGVAGPPDMPAYAAQKLEEVFKKVSENDQFKKYVDENVMQPNWLSSTDYGKWLAEESDRTRTSFDELGLLKKK